MNDCEFGKFYNPYDNPNGETAISRILATVPQNCAIEVTFPTGAKGCVNTNGSEYRIDLSDADPGTYHEARFTENDAVDMCEYLGAVHPDCEFEPYLVDNEV